jgi:hypothetical protein
VCVDVLIQPAGVLFSFLFFSSLCLVLTFQGHNLVFLCYINRNTLVECRSFKKKRVIRTNSSSVVRSKKKESNSHIFFHSLVLKHGNLTSMYNCTRTRFRAFTIHFFLRYLPPESGESWGFIEKKIKKKEKKKLGPQLFSGGSMVYKKIQSRRSNHRCCYHYR